MAKELQISAYDPRWPLEFEAERNRIAQGLGPIAHRIDHHGSTAVPGLDAKPIIDIQISVQQLQPIRRYAEPLATLGYVTFPMLTMLSAPSFIAQVNGRIRITFTLCNRVDRRSDVLWHSMISCASIPTSQPNTEPSRGGLLP